MKNASSSMDTPGKHGLARGMDTPSRRPDSSTGSSPEGDGSRGTEEATSPSWAHVVRREASASTGSFTKPKAIGGRQGPVLEPMVTGGMGARLGEHSRIRTEGIRREGGISIGSGCTEDLEGQVTIPLPRNVGTPESGGARDSPRVTSSSDSSASASDRSREDGHSQGQKRQRRKAQRVLAGTEETRSQRKRRQKKRQGADLMADATREDLPMELRQLYRAEGVGIEAAELAELGQIWLTREPPRTPNERVVEMRVQERAFAERWKERHSDINSYSDSYSDRQRLRVSVSNSDRASVSNRVSDSYSDSNSDRVSVRVVRRGNSDL
jgi:hypothetical protein